MGWVLRLVESGAEGPSDSIDVLEIERPGDLGDLADLGLRHAEGKQLLARVQQAVVAAQSRSHAVPRPRELRCAVPAERLSTPPDCHPVRPGDGPAAPLPLCRL